MKTRAMKTRTAYAVLALCISVAPAAVGQTDSAQHLAGGESQYVADLFSGWTLTPPPRHLPRSVSANYAPPTPEQQAKSEHAARLAGAAVLSLHAGRYAQAVEEARTSLSVEPSDGVPAEVLAAALDAQGKEQEALQAYRTVVEHYDRNPRNLLPYALLLLKSGQWGQAVTIYNAALPRLANGEIMRANSHFSSDVLEPMALAVAIHIARGLTYEAASDWAGESQHKEMMAEFGKALQLAPDSDLANYHYGYGWHSLDPKERANMGSVQQAKAALQKAVLLGKADVKKAARKVLKDLNKPTNKPA